MDTAATTAPTWQANDARAFPSDVIFMFWLMAMLVFMAVWACCCCTGQTSRRIAVTPDPDPSAAFTTAIPSPAPLDAAQESMSALHSRHGNVIQSLIIEKFRSPSSFVHCSCPRDNASHPCLCQQAQRAVELCAICLEPFVNGDDISISNEQACGHCFHVACALEWLVQTQKSPCCRHDNFDCNGIAVKSSRSRVEICATR